MNPAVVILSVLFFTSAILCVTMTLAWLHFGRQRHASTWALAYGFGALQWVINALGVLTMPGHAMPAILASLCVLVSSALVAIGARQRVGLAARTDRFVAAGALVAAALILVYTVYEYRGLQGMLSNLFAAAMMVVALVATWPRDRRASAPEWAFMTMLAIFALYQLGLTTAALAIGDGNREALEQYRAILGIGLPPVYIGTGIAATFLLAGDLSQSLSLLVTRDGLTGTLNRRGLEQAATIAMANARRRAAPLTVVVGDIDRFKLINDRLGHAAGDAALVAFADNVQAAVREEDILGRLGGDEFCLLLSDISCADAMATVERIRSEVEAIRLSDRADLRLTASFGMAQFAAEDLSFSAVLQRADQALYRAKDDGRNRICA